MAQITVTEIKGTDAMSASRITINNNFTMLASAINDIPVNGTTIGGATYTLNGANVVVGGSLQIGSTTLNETELGMLKQLIENQTSQNQE